MPLNSGRYASLSMPRLRIARERQWRDKFRKYRILVDGIEVARIKCGTSLVVDISEGPHELRAAIDWGSSPALSITVLADKNVGIIVGSNAGGGSSLVSQLTWDRNDYLFIREA